MIKNVDTFLRFKPTLEQLGFATNRNLTVTELGQLKETLRKRKVDITSAEFNALVDVYRDFRMVEANKIINDYATCEITKSRLCELLNITEQYDYRNYINEAAKMRSNISTQKRNMKVTWIYGDSATGKTSLATFLAIKEYGEDQVWRAAQGEHMFDDYDLQKVFIMEEFKGDKMKFSDYLQLTDNNTNVRMGARYHNVDFKNCKQMYLTSTNLPYKTYACMQEVEGESLTQAYRRLGFHYYEIVREDGIRGDSGIVYDVKLNENGTEKERRKIYTVHYPEEGAPEFTEYVPF